MKAPKAIALCALLLASACSKEPPPQAEEARSPAGGTTTALKGDPAKPAVPGEPAAQPAAATAVSAGQARISEETFELVLSPKGDYKAGQAGEAEIALTAKEPFHVNDKYPYKFKAKEGAGVKYAAPETKKDAVKLETMKATMTVGFTPESSGKHVLGGQFSFSVCTDDKCLIEKRDLSLEITAN